MVVTIIPTIGRDTLKKAINSVVLGSTYDNWVTFPIVETGGTAGDNRNNGLKKAKLIKPDWITFLDDDDFYDYNWANELDWDISDIVIFRMKQENKIIPDKTNELRFGNVGINFALNMNRIKWEDLPEFDSNGEGEDWRFLEQLLQKYNKVKITDEIYYVAPKRSYNQ